MKCVNILVNIESPNQTIHVLGLVFLIKEGICSFQQLVKYLNIIMLFRVFYRLYTVPYNNPLYKESWVGQLQNIRLIIILRIIIIEDPKLAFLLSCYLGWFRLRGGWFLQLYDIFFNILDYFLDCFDFLEQMYRQGLLSANLQCQVNQGYVWSKSFTIIECLVVSVIIFIVGIFSPCIDLIGVLCSLLDDCLYFLKLVCPTPLYYAHINFSLKGGKLILKSL